MVFRDAAFELKICSPDPSPLSTTGGFDIAVPHGLQALSRADIVILPTWHDDCRPAPAPLRRRCDAPTGAARASLACASAHSRWRKRECWMAARYHPLGVCHTLAERIQPSQLIVKCYM
jgi:hypothetical protein